MRILSLLPNLNGGGAQRVALDLAKQLQRMGDASAVCAAGAKGTLRHELGDLAFYGYERRISLKTLVPYVLFLWRCIRACAPQVLIVHLLPLNLLVLALVSLRFVRVPVLVVEHNHLSASHESSRVSWVRRIAISLLVRVLYPYASAVVGVSEDVSRDIEARLKRGSRVETVCNGIDVDRITRNLAEETWEAAQIAALPSPTVIAVGRLVHQKGFDHLVDAIAKVRLQAGMESTNLVILGDGPERDRLQEQARTLDIDRHVFFFGFVANPWAAMARSDVFVLSSRHEGFGLVVAEAVACGLPVCATDCRSGPAEILADNPLSRIVPVGDASAIAGAIIELLETDRKEWLGGLRSEYSLDEMARRYREILQDAIV